jgi:AcrR family transcriptional regulator
MDDLEMRGRPSRRARPGPNPSFSLEGIVVAAVRLADTHGLEAVTMRSVAAAVGLSAAGLYRYVAARDELVGHMVDRISAEVRHPTPTGDWVADFIEVAQDQVRVFRAHPWMVEAVRSLTYIGPHVLDHLDWGLDVLGEIDVTVQRKLEAVAMVNGVAALFSSSSQPGPDAFAQLDVRRQPRLAAALANATSPEETDDLFARAVAGLLQSLLGPPPSLFSPGNERQHSRTSDKSSPQ